MLFHTVSVPLSGAGSCAQDDKAVASALAWTLASSTRQSVRATLSTASQLSATMAESTGASAFILAMSALTR